MEERRKRTTLGGLRQQVSERYEGDVDGSWMVLGGGAMTHRHRRCWPGSAPEVQGRLRLPRTLDGADVLSCLYSRIRNLGPGEGEGRLANFICGCD